MRERSPARRRDGAWHERTKTGTILYPRSKVVLPSSNVKSLTLSVEFSKLGTLHLIAPSSNGKTADSGSVYRGSNPCGAATTKLGLNVKPNFVVGLIV